LLTSYDHLSQQAKKQRVDLDGGVPVLERGFESNLYTDMDIETGRNQAIAISPSIPNQESDIEYARRANLSENPRLSDIMIDDQPFGDANIEPDMFMLGMSPKSPIKDLGGMPQTTDTLQNVPSVSPPMTFFDSPVSNRIQSSTAMQTGTDAIGAPSKFSVPRRIQRKPHAQKQAHGISIDEQTEIPSQEIQEQLRDPNDTLMFMGSNYCHSNMFSSLPALNHEISINFNIISNKPFDLLENVESLPNTTLYIHERFDDPIPEPPVLSGFEPEQEFMALDQQELHFSIQEPISIFKPPSGPEPLPKMPIDKQSDLFAGLGSNRITFADLVHEAAGPGFSSWSAQQKRRFVSMSFLSVLEHVSSTNSSPRLEIQQPDGPFHDIFIQVGG
jgi:hypothetical protein